MKLLILFIILNIVNVILQTARALITIKCGTTAAAIANAIAYGLYTVVIIYTNCELSLACKVIVVALANFIGVYFVKFIENKLNKDKLWKIEATFTENIDVIKTFLQRFDSEKYTIIPINDKTHIINFYCYSKEDTAKFKQFCEEFNAKYFVTESKITLKI